MPKYFVRWDAGFGQSTEIHDAKNYEDALDMARSEWREEVESNADYSAEEITAEELENEGYDPRDYGLERVDPSEWEDDETED